MLQLRLHGPGDVRLDDVPDPVPGPRDAVVRVEACGLCGTDLSYIRLGGLAGPGPEPMALGHEIAGTVESAGPEVDVAVGTPVVVHPGDDRLGRIGSGAPEGGLATRLLVRDAAGAGRLHPVPDGIPLDVAALAEPVGVAMNAVDRLDPAATDRVAVFGAGPIGLAAVAVLADRGVTDVVAIDLAPERLRLAETLGASSTIDAAAEDVWARLGEVHGRDRVMMLPAVGTDAYVEASGASSVIPGIVEHAKRDARVSVVALHHESTEVSFLLVMMKQLTLTGSIEYPSDFGRTLELLARRDLSPLVTDHFPLERAVEAVDLLGSRTAGKVLVTP